MTAQTRRFPFSGVVGAHDAKLALLLAALDPAIGGVLLRGEKGSAKTTLARGLASLLAGDAPFVELPIGATEDRVIGSIDLQAALAGGEVRLRPGLLADADGGVLYVDEVNLLPDHLVDALLDVAASGVNRVEREGVAASHPARFVLIGSMNPEEGELRPQLLDRFGLAVEVSAPQDLSERAEAVVRRLAFDAGRVLDVGDDDELVVRLADAAAMGPAALAPQLVRGVGALCVAVGAQGLRADLVICRAAAALARWEGRAEVAEADVRRVAPMALAHRARRNPFDEHGIDDEQLAGAFDEAFGGSDLDIGDGGGSEHERVAEPDAPSGPILLDPVAPRRPPANPPQGRRAWADGERGRLVGDRPPGGDLTSVAVGATVRQAAVRRTAEPDGPVIAPQDLRQAVRHQRTGNLIVIAVDASGSMGAERRMEAAKGAVLGLLADAYVRRDRIALVTFRADGATVVLRPTGSVEVAQARLAALPTGGRTPLAAGILAALDVARGAGASAHEPLLVFVTDGRATAAPEGVDPLSAATDAAGRVRRSGIPAVVVDVEGTTARLGLAAELAATMGAKLLRLHEVGADQLRGAVRTVLG
ncbi:MAG: AAA family ATPase [Acidimicrobiales bacterium]